MSSIKTSGAVERRSQSCAANKAVRTDLRSRQLQLGGGRASPADLGDLVSAAVMPPGAVGHH
ncbi:MAG: hypothetical protein M3N47_00775 [Chloroflexota bacterium]|nr:hypothetical protein [Chloroflexota bacterium]